MGSRFQAALVAVGLLVVTGGCGREKERPHQATVNSAAVAAVSVDSAVDRLVRARCGHEASSCPAEAGGADAAPGASGKSAGCVERLGPIVKRALGPSACAEGLGPQELETCVTAMETESCSRPVDDIIGVAPCRGRDLCLKSTGAPYRLVE